MPAHEQVFLFIWKNFLQPHSFLPLSLSYRTTQPRLPGHILLHYPGFYSFCAYFYVFLSFHQSVILDYDYCVTLDNAFRYFLFLYFITRFRLFSLLFWLTYSASKTFPFPQNCTKRTWTFFGVSNEWIFFTQIRVLYTLGILR